MRTLKRMTLLVSVASACLFARAKVPDNAGKGANTSIGKYISEAENRAVSPNQQPSPGSLYSPGGLLANTSRDMRASQIDDIVTIVVDDRATAGSKGVSNSSRKSSANYGITAAYGPLKAGGPLTNLAGANGNQQMQGQGQTTRENNLTTTLSARVVHVLPNGFLVVEGYKNVSVNSDEQVVKVRGILRPSDVNALNQVRSERLSDLQIQINGRGIVNDAIKRPFVLYRILMGLLPI